MKHWNEIAQPDFGRPPSNVKIQIYVDGQPYLAMNKKLQMQMSQERVMKLLEGTSIYRDEYVGIREMIQNAVDASLIQLWYDIIQNRYLSLGLSRRMADEGLSLMELFQNNRRSIFGNYDITVELIKDLCDEKIYIVVKDKGIGITMEDVGCIANIGSGKENNKRARKIMDQKMPRWLKPSGVFGIGLQSVFQLTDCIEFYTRQPNEPEKLITLYSYGKNKGRIEMRDVPSNSGDLFYDNAVPGTNVKIAVKPEKIFGKDLKNNDKNCFQYYDPEFDEGNELDMIYAELGRVIPDKIKASKFDYFNIYFKQMQHLKDGTYKKDDEDKNEDKQHLRNSFFYPERMRENKEISRDVLKEMSGRAIYIHSNHRGRRHAGFLDWNIQVLDDNPTKYLNIDRDRLRDEAISEDELLTLRGKLLKLWCEYFIEKDRKKGKKENANRFEKSPQILLSFVFLFYQNVSAENFQKFLETYKSYITSNHFVLGEEHIPVSSLWNDETLFRTTVGIPEAFSEPESDKGEEAESFVSADTLSHLPHRLIQIEQIHRRNNQLLYCLKLHVSTGKRNAIDMDETAALFDYINAFEPLARNSDKAKNKKDKEDNINYQSVQKKVFKPDKRYAELLMPCYPRTFKKGRNFESPLDSCIRWYILSPFDNKVSGYLKHAVNEGKNEETEFLEHMKSSAQFQKCVNYILKLRYQNLSEEERARREQSIRAEYYSFIKDFYELLYKNRQKVLEVFAELNPQ